jgi:hydroxymethylpyrimidine/phosphomethylpyrimidine kinase
MDRGDAPGVTAKLPIALTIAGSDSGGGAGIQADLRTFAACGVYGASAVTALTVQNTTGVRAVHFPPPDIVAAQIEAVLADFDVAAIKIGMLGTADIVGAVAETLSSEREGRKAFVVYDPVMAASSGDALSGEGFVQAIRNRLLPLVDCLTPNLAEAAALLGESAADDEAGMTRQGQALLKLGSGAILMKGGHLAGDAVDVLVTPDGVRRYAAPRIASKNLHGTGCTLSSAIAARIVLGDRLPSAVQAAKTFVNEAIEAGRDLTLGAGAGPPIQAALRRRRSFSRRAPSLSGRIPVD